MADFVFYCSGAATGVNNPINSDSSGSIPNGGGLGTFGWHKQAGAYATKNLGFYVNGILKFALSSSFLNSYSYGQSGSNLFTASDSLSYIVADTLPSEEPPECDGTHPCPPGYRCIEGVCTPCAQQQAEYFQVRFEYPELVTTSDANQVMSTLSSIYPISGSSGQIIQGQETSGLWYYPRIRFCNAAGHPKPYSGALAFYGYCNPDGSTALYGNNLGGLDGVSWVIGQKARTDSVSSNPWSIPRLLVEFIEDSEVILEPDCSGPTPEPFPPIEPVEPSEPEEPETPVEPEPEDPIEKEEHEGEPTEPVKPDKPSEPENCDCENYIANSVQVGSDQIFDILGSLKNSIDRLSNNLTKDVDRVSLSINQAANVNNLALSAINTNLYNLLMFATEKFYGEIVGMRQDLQENLSCGDRGIACIVEKATLKTVNHPVAGEIEVGLVDSVIDYAGKNIQESVEEIEPVHIENEYRVQSRRTENFIDES